jgi:hypothetical protein
MCVPCTREDPMTRRLLISPTRLLPLGFLVLAALAGCDNHQLPTLVR